MYYYIFEPPKNRTIARGEKRVKELLGEFGIAGETAIPSPARTIEELIDMGIEKGYSTFVAVGAERLVNKMVSILCQKNVYRQDIQTGKKIVLGIIPLESSEQLQKLVGTTDPKRACEILKARKLELVDVAFVAPNKFFLTPAEIHTFRVTHFQLTVNDYHAMVPATDLLINRDLDLIASNTRAIRNPIRKFFRWMIGAPKEDVTTSLFHGDRILIDCPSPIPLTVNGELLAKTPLEIRHFPHALHLVTSRSIMREAPAEAHLELTGASRI